MGAPAGFGAAHAAAVGFVVVTEEVEEAVEEEDAEFGGGVVGVGGGLGGGAVPGDGDVAKEAGAGVGAGGPVLVRFTGWERQDVGGVVLAEEVSVHALELGIGGDEAAEGAAEGDFVAEGAGESLEFAAAEAGGAVFEENQGFLSHELGDPAGDGAGCGSGAAAEESSLRDIWRPMPDCSLYRS